MSPGTHWYWDWEGKNFKIYFFDRFFINVGVGEKGRAVRQAGSVCLCVLQPACSAGLHPNLCTLCLQEIKKCQGFFMFFCDTLQRERENTTTITINAEN